MPLSTTAIKTVRARKRPYKLFDEKGLYLSVEPSGSKLWRLKYRYVGKEKKLALGAYPETSLQEAREKRDEARKMLAAGTDPGARRKLERLGRALQMGNTFGGIGEEYIAKKAREGLAAVTVAKARWLLRLLAPKIGQRPIKEITAPELLAALRTVEERGNGEQHRPLFLSQAFFDGFDCLLLIRPKRKTVVKGKSPKVGSGGVLIDF